MKINTVKINKIIFISIVIFVIIILAIYITIYKKSYKFNDVIGTFNGVTAYSNQLGETNSKIDNYYNGIYTGIKWECTEFVRRYLIIIHKITFSEVVSAFQIPNATFTTLNGVPVRTSNELTIGSLVVWPKNCNNEFPHGHVAIISSILPSGIKVVEQNYVDAEFPRFANANELQNVTIISFPKL